MASEIFVEIEQICVSSNHDNSEEFGEWNEIWSNRFCGVCDKGKHNSRSVPLTFDYKPGDPIHFVWVEQSNGDSFGWADRCLVHVVDAFKSYDKACLLQWIIEDDVQVDSYVAEDGTVLPLHKSWNGFFDRLEDVHVDSVDSSSSEIVSRDQKWLVTITHKPHRYKKQTTFIVQSKEKPTINDFKFPEKIEIISVDIKPFE